MPDVSDRRGVTPLITAAACGFEKITSRLIEKLKDLVVPSR